MNSPDDDDDEQDERDGLSGFPAWCVCECCAVSTAAVLRSLLKVSARLFNEHQDERARLSGIGSDLSRSGTGELRPLCAQTHSACRN